MATVTGFTAERMQEIEDAAIVDGNVVGDNLILSRHDGGTIDAGSVRGPIGPTGSSPIVVTSSTRPTGGDLFEGLMIYETDTDRIYVYDGTKWVWLNRKFVKGYGIKIPAAEFSITSTTGVDWNSASPLNVSFDKYGDSDETRIDAHLFIGGYVETGFVIFTGGLRISGVDYWGLSVHEINVLTHFQRSDLIEINGLDAGTVTMRARLKIQSGSNTYKADTGDHFRIEYEEVPI